MSDKISAILLAAGQGRRFGENKLLVPFRGSPLISASLGELLRSSVSDVVVVVGADSWRLRQVCATTRGRMVENPDWERGMSSSILIGLASCGPDTSAAVVALADQPLIRAEAIDRLILAFRRGAKAAVATYNGAPRNPALFSRELWPLLRNELSGDKGARTILARYPKIATPVPCDDIADPSDVDTPNDLLRLEKI